MITDFIAKMRTNRFDHEYLPSFESKLFFEGERKNKQIMNFIVLLALATVIATYGFVTDSTASVIGAMIIAPLMTPIMAAAAAVTMGSTIRLGQALRLVALGILGVIVLAMLLTFFIPDSIISFPTNSQITSRVSPGLLDLVIALAAGAAGAYAIGRQEIADSLAGVAIAISLVPPLSVVGISLAKEQWVDSGGGIPPVSYQLFCHPARRCDSLSSHGAGKIRVCRCESGNEEDGNPGNYCRHDPDSTPSRRHHL